MLQHQSIGTLLEKIEDLENRLSEAHQLIDAIKEGEVDAFAIRRNNASEIFTLQSGDYAYRVLIEKFGEGALNLTEEGMIVYCNASFYQLLGMPYEKVIGSFIFDLITEEYQEHFRKIFESALNGNSRGETVFYVNDRYIPVYVSLTSLQPGLDTVGMIVTDLTEKKRHEKEITHYTQQLSAKNRELESQNAELASFTYIASHDLQEPLRKIQAFSGRILEKEKERFSDTGKDYFMRIKGAAARMQNLIEALLNYSRTGASNLIFKSTDLNRIVEEVRRDLQDDIRDKDAIIESVDLPVVSIVPLQFHQLLANLISNAIKYSRRNIQPLIKISATVTVPTDEETGRMLLQHDRYWKISIEDNGIGFKQEYMHRIFELFQRLHGRMEYEGTGIGLAICKKIIKNHNGFISAVGQPGIGSTFNVFLPYVP